jgi:spore photoproduct lyase
LLDAVAVAVSDVPGLDLTAELITHRFTPGSKEVLLGFSAGTRAPGSRWTSRREAASTARSARVKYVYPPEVMAELRGWFEPSIAERLPACRILYWT